jgi:hypothetical protein
VDKNSRFARAIYCVVAGLLLVVSGLSFNAALANWFFADFHNEYSRQYAARGNTLFLLALIFLAACIWLVVAISRSIKKSQKTA